MAEQEWEPFVLAFDVGFEFMRDLADPEPRWADREEALAWLRDEIQNRRGERDRPAETHVFEVGEMLCRLCEQPIASPLHVRHREGDRA